LPCFGIGLANPLPQAFQRLSPSIGAKFFIGTQTRHNGLNYFLRDAIGAGFALPKVEHFGKSANDGGIGVFVFVFETKEFSKFF
jgi:hypothetical protein